MLAAFQKNLAVLQQFSMERSRTGMQTQAVQRWVAEVWSSSKTLSWRSRSWLTEWVDLLPFCLLYLCRPCFFAVAISESCLSRLGQGVGFSFNSWKQLVWRIRLGRVHSIRQRVGRALLGWSEFNISGGGGGGGGMGTWVRGLSCLLRDLDSHPVLVTVPSLHGHHPGNANLQNCKHWPLRCLETRAAT